MIIAVLSDIHSNPFALKAVLDEIENRQIRQLAILGDLFGYYPWAVETYKLLQPYKESAYIIKGNHDQLLLDAIPPVPVPSYWLAAKSNEEALKENCPEALDWLQSLDFEIKVEWGNKQLHLVHGTPADTKEGRYYPDNQEAYNWFPQNGAILLMGHTHYPLYKKFEDNSMIINPGSVGQPRDADTRASWGILNMNDGTYQHIRTAYNNIKAMSLLEKMGWDKRAIAALNKTNQGALKL